VAADFVGGGGTCVCAYKHIDFFSSIVFDDDIFAENIIVGPFNKLFFFIFSLCLFF